MKVPYSESCPHGIPGRRAHGSPETLSLKTRRFLLVAVSAGLMILSHPRFDVWPLAWTALVPLLLALEGASYRQAFKWGYVWGMIFFSGTLYWFIHMAQSAAIPLALALLATVSVILYLSLYPALFAVGQVRLGRKPVLARMVLLPGWWVVLEWVRDHLLTGFSWLSLGYSQYRFLPVIQIADVTGFFGVSFLVMMVNVYVKDQAALFRRRGAGAFTSASRASVLAGFLVTLTLFYGLFRMSQLAVKKAPDLLVAIAQGNIPQDQKWQQEAREGIMRRYLDLTDEVVKAGPDLVIWPETSFPGYLWENAEGLETLKADVARRRVPLLFGAVDRRHGDYFNTAILLDESGKEVARQNKWHLVPFGEYIPLRAQLPFLEAIVPIADFSSGDGVTLFSVPSRRSPAGAAPKFFSVLICFEDTVPRVARRMVQAGAGLLVNITNDGWFLDSPAPFQHLQAAVFRTVENRRGLVRVTNTGVSCFIDRTGRIAGTVQDQGQKKTCLAGTSVRAVDFWSGWTFYTRFGDLFVLICLGGLFWGTKFVKDL